MEEKECLEKLFLTNPSDDLNALKRRKGGRVTRTCEWILESPEIRQWLRKESQAAGRESNILWLHGNPGTGKSTMAITLAEKLPEDPLFAHEDATLTSFFCDSSSKKHRTATAVLRGLLYQAIQKHPPLLRPLVSKYRGHKDKLFSSFDALWSVLMEIGNSSGVDLYCIINALDECDDESQESLLTQLNRNSTVARFLEGQPDTLLSSPAILKAAAAWGNRQIVARILQSHPVLITDKILEAAAANFSDDEEIICMLLAKSGSHITERMIQASCEGKVNILSFLRDETRNTIPTSTDTLSAALNSPFNAVETLLRYPIDATQITEEFLVMVGRCYAPEQVFPLIFKRFGDQIRITKKVVTAVIQTYSNNLLIAELLNHLNSATTLTKAVIVAAAKSRLPTPELIELFTRLLRMIGDDNAITEATFVAVAGNKLSGARKMQLLLSRRSDFEIPESVSKAAVFGEGTNADPEVMEVLLESKGDTVPITEEVLLEATRNVTYRYRMFRLLVQKRFDSVRSCLTKRLLLTIAASGDMMILSLLQRRFGVLITTELRSICRLYIGARDGSRRVVQSLLRQGVPPDTRSADGETPLWMAAANEHDLIVKDLFATDEGDVDAVPMTGESPLIKAVESYNVPIVRLLLAAGANPNLARKDGKTAYALAKEGSYLRMMAIMREYGAK